MCFIYDFDSKRYVRVSKKCFQAFVLSRYAFFRTFDDDTIFFYDELERELGFMHYDGGCCFEY